MPRSPPPALDLRLLGPVEVRIDGRVVALGAPKQRAVLAMLALEAGRTVSADRLAEGLWGEQPPASAPKMVQLYVSQLRRLLDGDGAQIVTRGRGYELRLGHGEVDVDPVRALLEQDRAARGARAVARRGARRRRRRAVRRRRDPAPRRAAAARRRAGDRRRPRGRPPRRGDRRARGAGRRSIRCASGCTPSACSRCTGPAARPRRWTPTARRAPRWSTRSASSRAPSCGASTRRSWPRTRRSTSPRRRSKRPGPRVRRPAARRRCFADRRAAAVRGRRGVRRQPRAGAGQPPGHRRELGRADRRRQRPDHGPVQRRATGRRPSPPAPARCGSPTGWTAPSRGSTATARPTS